MHNNAHPSEKLLVLIEGHIPTVEIILRCLSAIHPSFQEIKIVTLNTIEYDLLFSGEYKILMLRICNPAWMPLLKLIFRFNLHYIYYLDDNFWELTGNHPLAKGYQDKRLLSTLNQAIQHAAIVLTGSLHLAAYVRKHFHSNARYVPAGFDFSLLTNLHQEKTQDKIKIIYSGSLYRDQDFTEVNLALLEICKKYADKIQLYFFGYMPKALAKLKMVYHDKNYADYTQYIKKQYVGNFDIGLAPLKDTISNRSKSNLKYREYGACRIAGIYTNIDPYQDCVINRKNGLLVEQKSEDWYQALELLIEDAQLLDQLKNAARHDVESNLSTTELAPAWQKPFLTLQKNKPRKLTYSQKRSMFIYRKLILFKYLLGRTFTYVRTQGLWSTFKKMKCYLSKG